MQANKRLSEQAIATLREAIEDAGGNEVFALGFLDESGRVARIRIAARGNEVSVPALQDKLENADVLIHNHPSGFLSPSDADMVIASQAAEGGTGSFIVDNRVERVYAVAEPARRRMRKKLDPLAITGALEEGGAIAARLPVYETRQSQLDLMQLIIKAFNEDAIAAAEAGTGVGKSFAYLLPALRYAEENEERIVISTATITLQQQLYEKDIPLVAGALGGKIKTALIKGRGNYLCLRRLEDALKEPSLDEGENETIDAIARWAETTGTGCRSDLSFMPAEGIWSRLCSEADTCMGLRCPDREKCFVFALRREAADAKILIVNHHLLFADLAARREGAGYDNTVVLPPYNRVIIDEAHTIEDAATSFFSAEFSRFGVYRHLGRLYRKRARWRGGGAAKSGLLVRLMGILPGNQAVSGTAGEDMEDRVAELIDKIRNAAEDLDEAALGICGSEGVFRFTPQRDDVIKTLLAPLFTALRKQINFLGGMIREMLEQVPDTTAEEGTVWEVKSILRRLDAVGNCCTSFLEYQENPGNVMWIEKRQSRQDPWAEFTVTPLDVALSLKESLFDPNKTVVCVSATLTVGNSGGEASFWYWKNRSGLALVEERKILTGVFPSPFPYKSSVLLAVPSDAPLPAEPGFGVFVDSAAGALAEISGGSALILFTSYLALQSAWEKAKPLLEKQGIQVLKQGDDDRARLLSTFLADESSVLFATDSFWEGVDAPGDTLRLVILCRLPFRTPNDPVFEARCERVEQEGGNAFMDLSVPEAVMKFKQGFGRLMRRSSDHGVVAVLDGRLLKKRYGRTFLDSLPQTKTCYGDFKTVLRRVEEFLFP
ncbi:MAG: ATP-dependent DNA helicase DinG [Treponema sp.]|nr:ATP-dependent DNA helicase DinG [Treponema sp.]